MDNKQKDQSDAFAIAAVTKRDQLERDGILCRHEKQQPKQAPKLNEHFIGTNIEQLCNFTKNNGTTVHMWCKVTVVIGGGVTNLSLFEVGKKIGKWEKKYI